MRFDIVSPFGVVLYTLTSNGALFQMNDVKEKQFLYGPPSPCNLARLTHDRMRASTYRNYALRIVDTLVKPPYLAEGDSRWEGILKRGVYHIHKELGVDESVMWGEFFFVEALKKALAELR